MIQHKVCVVTVTYGDRWKFLNQVLIRVLSLSDVCNVVVVNNASVYSISDQVSNAKVFVLNNERNEGSAGGYHKGIAYAFEHTDADFIWLLDDDNLPAENAFTELIKFWETITGGNDQKALFCLREDRLAHINITKGEDPARYYLSPDSFFGFSVFRMFKNQVNKLRDRFRNADTVSLPYAKMPYVPYGGLLMHRQMVSIIGYPDTDFFLYVDDSEYTYRITQRGAAIYLISSAKIVDIDKSQGITYQSHVLRSQLLDLWNDRTYYHIRNRTYFYSRVAVKNKFMFNLNKSLYLSFLKLISIISNKRSAYLKLKDAVNDGLNRKLGKVGQDKF